MELSELEVSILKGIRMYDDDLEFDELCRLLNVTTIPEILVITLNGEICLNINQRQSERSYSEVRMTIESLIEHGYLDRDGDKIRPGKERVPIEVYRGNRSSINVNDSTQICVREGDDSGAVVYNITNYIS